MDWSFITGAKATVGNNDKNGVGDIDDDLT
jgi:hypothetical protein